MSSDAGQIMRDGHQIKKDDLTKKEEECVKWTLEEEFKRNEKLQRADVESLRKFSISQPKVDDTLITDQVIVALLHSAEYDLERAKTIATKYFEIRLGIPEVFTGRHLDSDAIKGALEVGYYVPLPRKTPDGFRVIIQGLRNTDVSLFNHVALCKIQTLIMDSIIHSDPICAGYIFVCDMQGVSFGHMWKQSLSLGRKLMNYFHEGVPLKIQQLHCLNTSSFTLRILQVFKPFISKRLWDMFSLYTSDEMEEFWKKVPKECLPKDYGGELPETETFHQELINEWLPKVTPELAVI